MDAERIGRRRNVEDPPRCNVYGQLDNTSSISLEKDNDGADGQEVCQMCNDSTSATRPFVHVEGALDFLQNADCEYYGPLSYTIYGSPRTPRFPSIE